LESAVISPSAISIWKHLFPLFQRYSLVTIYISIVSPKAIRQA
jgi:hypothetical protein